MCLYSAELTVKIGSGLATYLVKKAPQYVDACGEPIDVMVLSESGCETISPERIKADIQKMEDQEAFLFTLLIQTPFSSPTVP
jgi:hypothetical protein